MRQRLTLQAVLVISLGLLGCTRYPPPRVQRDNSFPIGAVAVVTPCTAAPGSLFADSTLRDRTARYQPPLQALGEGRLCALPPDVTEAYRFLWLRSFHHPVAITVEYGPTVRRIRARETNGYDGAPGKLIYDQTRPLDQQEWQQVAALVKKARLWQPPRPRFTSRGGSITDGAQWIVEGVREGNSSALVVTSPTPDGPNAAIRELCLRLLTLAERLPADGSSIY